jgi:hypothetical protein
MMVDGRNAVSQSLQRGFDLEAAPDLTGPHPAGGSDAIRLDLRSSD